MFEKEAEEYIEKLTEDWNDGEYSFSVDDMRKAILYFAEFGYNKAKKEMQENGLALQSDMDKTIEQNFALKKN